MNNYLPLSDKGYSVLDSGRPFLQYGLQGDSIFKLNLMYASISSLLIDSFRFINFRLAFLAF